MRKLERIASLDAFRGAVIALMMFVNFAGGDSNFPGWIGHRGWNDGHQGIGLADVVFPLFIFIMGAGAWLTIRSAKERELSAIVIIKHAFLRSCALYLCGTILKCASIGFDQPLTWRVLLQWDILQMLAWTGLMTKVFLLGPVSMRYLVIVLAIAWKWYLLGMMTFGDNPEHIWTPQTNAQRYLIGEFGWFGVAFTQGAGATALCMIGAECARMLFDSQDQRTHAKRISIMGFVSCVIAIGWTFASPPIAMPLSKDFFTSSFVLLHAGIGALLLALLWHLIDDRGAIKLMPLCVLGKHALAVYMTAELVWRIVLTRWKVASPDGSVNTMLSGLKSHVGAWTTPPVASWITVAVYVTAWFIFAHIREKTRRGANNPA